MHINPVIDHYDIISPGCKERINKLKSNLEKNPIPQFKSVIEWLEVDEFANLKRLIISKPKELLKIYREEIKVIFVSSECIYTDKGMVDYRESEKKIGIEGDNEPNIVEKVTNCWKYIFNYDSFVKNHSYQLAEKLDVRVCPYCNRQYTSTVIIKSDKDIGNRKERRFNIIRPEFDHYFPQERYPMFALSLYNLIPSCHVCNSNIKGKKELDIINNFHPYIDEDKNFKFIYMKNTGKNDVGTVVTSGDNVNITVARVDEEIEDESINDTYRTRNIIAMEYGDNIKAKNTCDFFYLPEIYKEHSNLADEIEDLRNDYPSERIQDMLERINRVNDFENSSSVESVSRYGTMSKKEMLQLVFGKFMVRDEDQEILGKLRNDLYKQISNEYENL